MPELASSTPASKAGKTTLCRKPSFTGRMTTSMPRSWESRLRSAPLCARVFLGDQAVDLLRGGGLEDGLPETWVLEQPRDAGQGLEVDARRVLRRHQGEEEVGGLAVDGVEVHALARDAEGGAELRQPVELAVRDGHALADPRGAQLLPLPEHLHQPLLPQAGLRPGQRRGQLAQDLRLAGGVQVRDDGVGG